MASPQREQDPWDEPEQFAGLLMYTHSRLRLRGWTDKMIQELLGEPDERRPQPGYPQRAPYRLYLPERVEAIEDSAAFRKAQRAVKKKRQVAEKAQADRMQALRQQVEDFPIQLLKLSPGELAPLARESFNAWAETSGARPVTPTSEAWYQDSAKVHFLRLSVPGYSELFGLLVKQRVDKELRRRLVERVLQEIARAYPGLQAEAERQNKRRLFVTEKEQKARNKRAALRKARELEKKKALAERRITPSKESEQP